MEFFNYEYCTKLNRQNEIDRLNITINNIKKDIDIKKTHIKEILESYIKYNCLTKLKLLNLKHIIIKFILNLNNTKKLIISNTTELNIINNEIDKINSIKFNYSLYKNNIILDTNKLNYTLHKLLSKYVNNKESTNNTLETNINILFIFIIYFVKNNKLSDCINIFNDITLQLSKLVCKKNKKLYNILNKYLYDEKFNIKYIDCIIYKILNLNKLFNLNKDITEFFKIKKNNNINNKTLYSNKKTLLKIIKKSEINEINTHKILDNKIKLYNKLYINVYKKHNNMCKSINKHEKNIVKLTDLLNIFNNKFILLNNEIQDVSLVKCPIELQQKCVNFNDNNHTCCICLDPIKTGIRTSCNHIYHIYCINLYIYSILNNQIDNINIICPLCRKYI